MRLLAPVADTLGSMGKAVPVVFVLTVTVTVGFAAVIHDLCVYVSVVMS